MKPTARTLSEVAMMAVNLIDDALALPDDDPQRAELLDEATRLIDGLAVDIPDKLNAYRGVAVRMEAEARTLREEEQRLASRRRAAESGVERMRAAAAGMLVGWRELGHEPKIKTAEGTYWLQESQSIRGPERVEDWPVEWQRVTVAPDRAAASKAAKAGTLPEGFGVVTSESVRWR